MIRSESTKKNDKSIYSKLIKRHKISILVNISSSNLHPSLKE